MGISVGGKHTIGNVIPVSKPELPPSRNVLDLIADKLQAKVEEEAIRKIEERDTLPVDNNRPIFNSIIDRKENSRYMLDLVKV